MSLERVLFSTKVAVTRENDYEVDFKIVKLGSLPFVVVAELLAKDTVIQSNGVFVKMYEIEPRAHKKLVKLHRRWMSVNV